jgi:hypothetical protein
MQVSNSRRRVSSMWMDQFCINYGDEDEKLISIAARDLIYKSARLVVMILGDISITKSQ